jgi:hypothetical protein
MSSWTDALLTGVGAAIDSQRPHDYSAAPPSYNTAGGVAGQAQQTAVAIASSPVFLIGALVVVGLVIYLAVRR